MLLASRRALLAIARQSSCLPRSFSVSSIESQRRAFTPTKTLVQRAAPAARKKQKKGSKMEYLPLPYSPQKHVIQSNKPAAEKLRKGFPVGFIRQPVVRRVRPVLRTVLNSLQETLETFSANLGVEVRLSLTYMRKSATS